MKHLLSYFKPYIKESILAPLFKLLEAVFELLVPMVIAGIVDQSLPQKNQGHLWMQIGLLLIFAVIGVVVALIAQFYSAKAAVGFAKELTNDLYRHILSLPKDSRDRLTTSSLVTRLISDTYQIQTGINQFLRLFLRAPIIVFGAIFMAYRISAELTFWFLVMVVILTIVIVGLSRLVNPLYSSLRKKMDQLVQETRQQLQGMRVIRAFGQEKRELQIFQTLNQVYARLQEKTGFWSSLLTPLTYLIVNGTLLFIIWQGYVSIQGGLLSQGALIALINYLLQILVELVKLAMLINSLNQSYISAKRIEEVFAEAPEDIHSKLEQKQATSDQVLQVQELTFTYPDAAQPSLRDISFDMTQGQILGIIGGTGSGKSSLVQLIPRLYDVEAGQVKVAGHDVKDYDLDSLRKQVAMVLQTNVLFSGTIKENMRWGNKNATDEEIIEACKIAQADEFIQNFKDGYDTMIERGGANVSGGQRQRLCIARALLMNPKILILDDSTSAVDTKTDSLIRQGLATSLKDTTKIIIGQRISSIQDADRIVVMNDGKIDAIGTHHDLIETNAIYREVYDMQTQGKGGQADAE